MISKDTLFLCVYIHNNRHCPSVKKFFILIYFINYLKSQELQEEELQLLKEKDVNKVYNKKKKKEIEQLKQFEARNFYVQSVSENNLHLIKKVHKNLKAIRIVAKENNGANQDKRVYPSGKRTIPRNSKTRDMGVSSDLPLLSSSETEAWGVTSMCYLDLGVVICFGFFPLFLFSFWKCL